MLLPKPPRTTIHTIHRKVDHVPYVLHFLQKDDSYKTTILSFTEKKDAHLIATVFEQYQLEKGHLPNNEFSYDRPFELEFHSSTEIKKSRPLIDFYIAETQESDMYEYCARNMFDLILVGDLDNNARIKLYGFDVSMEYVRNRFEKSLQ